MPVYELIITTELTNNSFFNHVHSALIATELWNFSLCLRGCFC